MDRNKAEFKAKFLRFAERQAKNLLRHFLSMFALVFGFGDHVITVIAATTTPMKIVWLWDQRIPVGRLTLFVGNPDNGKSMVATDVAARITTGRDCPDGKNPWAACRISKGHGDRCPMHIHPNILGVIHEGAPCCRR